MDNTTSVSSHIGSNISQGKDFNIYSSNTSFEVLSKYDKAIRKVSADKEDHSTSKISDKIANSIIICAPQIEDPNYLTYTKVVTTKYIDNDGNGKYSYGDSIISQIESDKKDIYDGIRYKDNGQFDLVVTDNNGVPVCITPPFNDIDTSYFTTSSSAKADINRLRKYADATFSLTLSDDFRKTIGNANEYIANIPISYTPIVPDRTNSTYLIIKKGSDENLNQKNYYVGKLEKDTDENGDYLSYTIDGQIEPIKYYPKNKDASTKGYSFIKVSFSYLLDQFIEFNEWKEMQFNKDVPPLDNSNLTNKSVAYKLAYLLNAVNDLNNRPYMYSLNNKMMPNDETRRYVWFGNKDDYKNAKKYEDAENTAFIINKE